LNLKGSHYLLTPNHFQAISKILKISGISHHSTIDKNGTILHRNALRPILSNKEVNKDLIKILNGKD